MDTILKKCPSCEGDIILVANPFRIDRDCDCFARCEKCNNEYDLPAVELEILKNLRVSKETIRQATMAWNSLTS